LAAEVCAGSQPPQSQRLRRGSPWATPQPGLPTALRWPQSRRGRRRRSRTGRLSSPPRSCCS